METKTELTPTSAISGNNPTEHMTFVGTTDDMVNEVLTFISNNPFDLSAKKRIMDALNMEMPAFAKQ